MFRILKFLNRRGWKLDYLSMAYSLSNICTKNYWNRRSVIKIIVSGRVVYFFETQCSYITNGVFPVCIGEHRNWTSCK